MDFNYEPYWDDFQASNGAREQNYMRILFRPGYSVQARELTQMQTIIQNQIKQFGNHIFRNGSPVYGGHMTLDRRANYIKLEPTYNSLDVDPTEYIDRLIFNVDGTAKKRAKVIAAYDDELTPTLMIRMMSGVNFSAGETISTSDGFRATLKTSSQIPVGFGSVAHINEGVFYVNGFFVYIEPQNIVLDPYGTNPTYKVGLEVDEMIVDEGADGNLLDPAQSSFNYQAPGAHRYQCNLKLAKRPLDSVDDETFFELMRVENGSITKLVSETQYAAIEGLLARRTYDESGNYVVKQFNLTLAANTSDDNKFFARISEGKAYVSGYDYELTSLLGVDVNKARSTQKVVGYDLSLGFGNYIVTQDLKIRGTTSGGLPDITTFPNLHMHCVTTDKISYSSAATYNATYVGYANLVKMDRDGAEYISYFDNITVTSNTLTTTAESSGVTDIKFPSNYSSQDDAYKGVKVRVLTGASAGDSRTITGYVGSTKIATVDVGFTTKLESGAKLEMTYDVVNIQSIIDKVPSSLQANLTMNVSSRSQTTGTTKTYLSDVKKRSLIFPLADSYVKYNSIVDADYYFIKYISSKEFVATSATSAAASFSFSDGSFPSGIVGAVSENEVARYVIIVNKTTGLIVAKPAVNVTTATATDLTITCPTTGSASFYADVYITLKVDNSENSTKRVKTLVGDSTTKTLATGQVVGGTAVTNQPSVRVDSVTGFIWFTDNSIINKNLGGATSLYQYDVFRIKAIYDSLDPDQDPTALNSIEITDRFLLDSGQRDTIYDHSSIVLKPGAAPPTGRIVVMAQWFQHSGTSGYFSSSSYPESMYNNGTIPSYYSGAAGKTFQLRDCVDFRPTRTARTTAYTIFGYRCVASVPMELTYEYYLPRVDSIVVTADRTLKVVEGAPTKNPIPPKLPADTMQLFTLNIPAYTPNVSVVKATSMQNMRYTMKDISKLEERIDQLEYYTAMSLAEKDSVQKTIIYTGTPADSTKVGTEKEKYGILVDNFTDFNSADTYSYDYFASIDNGVLIPVVEINALDLDIKSYDASAISVNDKTISLPFTETVGLSQLLATSNVSVQPYLYGTFNGMLRLSPELDTVHSFDLPPVILDDKGTVIKRSTEIVVSENAETGTNITQSKKNTIKGHYKRWVAKSGKNYLAVSQKYNAEQYNTSPNQTIRDL